VLLSKAQEEAERISHILSAQPGRKTQLIDIACRNVPLGRGDFLQIGLLVIFGNQLCSGGCWKIELVAGGSAASESKAQQGCSVPIVKFFPAF
jgi:hypothetical protein